MTDFIIGEFQEEVLGQFSRHVISVPSAEGLSVFYFRKNKEGG